ncbi:MAG: hypothetical protein HIU91_02635 [Acidobacteria bacterium]|nr:hypothetical protein [Acidobacteriota bacterium]
MTATPPTQQSTFPQTWRARILTSPPLIAPARQFVYPLYVPGEDDAMGRGALLLDIKPANAPNFLATCALGFRDPTLPTGIFPCPRPDDILAVAGGYAYLIDTLAPERCLHLPVRPTTQVLSAPSADVILLAGFHNVIAIDATGLRWQSARLSWEGVTLTEVRDGHLHGTGWDLHTDRELPFTLDVTTGHHTGGGFQL